MKKNLPVHLQPALSRFIHFHDDFERQLEQEIMVAESLRSRFLALAFCGIGLLTALANLIFPELIGRIFQGGFRLLPVLAVFAGFAAYELAFQLGIGFFQRRGLKFPVFPKLANAVIEVSFPTVLCLMLLTVFPPHVVLMMPPVFVYFLFIILSALRLEPGIAVFTGVVASGSYLALALALLEGGTVPGSGDWWVLALPWISKGGMLLIAGVIAAFVAGQIRVRLVGVIQSREERNLIAGIFGQHVSPEVMERLIHQTDGMDCEVREVCVFFLDIRDFTRFSHSRNPDEVVGYLNTLFDFMIEIVNRNHGVINKFLGDGFMALFGAPLEDGESSLNAVRTALEISDRLATEVAAGRVEPTRVGIGIHYGRAVTGSVGSQLRKEYTVIGDVVNLASRIEQLNKDYQSEILLSGEAWEAAQASMPVDVPPIGATVLGEVTVKGRAMPVRVIRLR